MRRLLLLLALVLCASGCGSLQSAVATAAPFADPLLRAIGFCQRQAPASRVAPIVKAFESGDRMGALLGAASIVEDLRSAGVDIPEEVYSDLVRTLAAIEGMQRGLRALDNRDAEGRPIERPKPPEAPVERPAGEA